MSKQTIFDAVIIGGGINGAAIARDAAGRGLNIMLVERGDLAQATSSASSKMIHGGLRYLENYEFSMVRNAIKERARLARNAPHLVSPQAFILPHNPSMRPAIIIRFGLFLYDLWAGKDRPGKCQSVRLAPNDVNNPLAEHHKSGFVYWDGVADDARLTVNNAVDAHLRGATIRTRCECIDSQPLKGIWRLTMHDLIRRQKYDVRTRAVINAAGPFANRLMTGPLRSRAAQALRMVQGAHIVVKRPFASPLAYTLQHSDGRIVFVLPYERHYLLIGTTETEFRGNPVNCKPTKAEIDYLIEAYNQNFVVPISQADIVWHFSGVRALPRTPNASAGKTSREAVILKATQGTPPMITLYGGKLTTHRQLAEQIVNALCRDINIKAKPWTANASLAGAPRSRARMAELFTEISRQHPWLDHELVQRYGKTYGTRTFDMLKGVTSRRGMGKKFEHGIYACELIFTIQTEWVRTLDDFLWRRGKTGLLVSKPEKENMKSWMGQVVRRITKSAAPPTQHPG